jgi:hypothetical protein
MAISGRGRLAVSRVRVTGSDIGVDFQGEHLRVSDSDIQARHAIQADAREVQILYNGILAKPGAHSHVSGMTVTGAGGVISGNTIDLLHTGGSNYVTTGVEINAASGYAVTSNVVRVNFGGDGTGISIAGASAHLISQNVVGGFPDVAIRVAANTSTISFNEIDTPTFEHFAIQLTGSGHLVERNAIRAYGLGISLADGNRCIGNTVHTVVDAFIIRAGSSNVIAENVLIGNTSFSETSVGISMKSLNLIENNLIAAGTGVEFSGDGNAYRGNMLRGTSNPIRDLGEGNTDEGGNICGGPCP